MLQKIVDFFNHIESYQRLLIFVSVLIFFSIIEGVLPLRKFLKGKSRHVSINLFLTATTFIINAGLAFILFFSANWVTNNHFGVSNLFFQNNFAFHLLVSILLLDLFSAWLPHFIEHKVKWLWQFHVVHHSDTIIDVTTAHRHHPGEMIIRFIFTTMAIFISGAGIGEVMLYQTLSSFFAMWAHVNIRIPYRLDKLLSYVFITPNVHRIHHHFKQPLSDKNMGNMISLWDRIFGTFAYSDSKSIVYGIDTYPEEEENNKLGFLLKLPFLGYRVPKQDN